MADPDIRALTAKDIKAVVALHAQGFEKGWPESEMQTHIENDLAMGCFSNDAAPNLLGFILIRIVYDQAEVLTLAVHPDTRRLGVARRLLDAVNIALKSGTVKSLFLEVAEDNLAAIALYKASNFEAFGRRPAYYKRKDGRVAALNFAKRF